MISASPCSNAFCGDSGDYYILDSAGDRCVRYRDCNQDLFQCIQEFWARTEVFMLPESFDELMQSIDIQNRRTMEETF
jgi:hypothetical protein